MIRNRQHNTVTIGQYNVKNLFDDKDQNPELGTVQKPRKELEALARTIQKSGAEILTLQEVENKEVLQQFVDEYLPDFGHVVLVEGNDHRGIDVAVISKHDVTNVVSHAANKFPDADGNEMQFNRDLLRVDLDVKGYPLSIFTSHFKSKRGGEWSEKERIGEARETRRILKEEMGDWSKRNFIVTGDLNDTPGSKTINEVRFGGSQAPRKQSKQKRGGSQEPVLRSALERLPVKERNTWPSKGPKEQIDHILYPEHMEDNLITTRVWRDKIASDHCMVTAEFSLTA